VDELVRVASEDQGNPWDGFLLTFVVGAKQAIPWLDECVTHMREGETVSICSADDKESSPTVLSRVVLVRVVSSNTEIALPITKDYNLAPNISKKRIESGPQPGDVLSPSQVCLNKAEERRATANAIITDKEVTLKKRRSALPIYHEALEWNRQAGELRRDELTVRILLNIALVLGKMDDWQGVLLYCDAALELDPKNAKAYFRRGQAGAKLGFHIRSVKDLERAAELAPGDSAVRSELTSAKRASADLLRRTRRQFAEVYNVMVQSPIYSSIKD
jgi:tetratricopeptide (TPR) repeat protein